MKNTTKRYIRTVIAALFGLLLVWLTGYNFDQRGAPAIFAVLIIIGCAMGAWTYPFKDENGS